MIAETEINNLPINQRLLAREMLQRGISVQICDYGNDLLEASYGTHREIFYDIDSSVVPFSSSVIAGSKSITKHLLRRASLSVPTGGTFSSERAIEAAEYALEVLGLPVVIKPSFGVHGTDVHTDIRSYNEALAAISSIVTARGHCEILVEEYFKAPEFRVFITRSKRFAVLHRDPAHVIGNGKDSLSVLAASETRRRARSSSALLCAIEIDDECRRFLARRNMSLDSIPAAGQKVYLRGSSNVMLGGVTEDFTDKVHSSLIDVCHRALLAIPNLPYAGIDLLCTSPVRPLSDDSYRILEINSAPGLGIHAAPAKGQPRNVAAMVVDLVFPETVVDSKAKMVAA